MTDKFTVHITYTASASLEVRADSPSKAIEAAYKKIGIITLCHHCADEIEIGDPIRVQVEDLDGNTVLEEEV